MAKRILVVDDDTAVRSMIALWLRRHGFEVLTAADGDEGIDSARAQLPDLVLCDVKMEPTDGYAVLRALRSELPTSLVPFILMTGSADQEGMREGMTLGADDYVGKPFAEEELLAAIHTRLKRFDAVRVQAGRELAELRRQMSSMFPHELLTPLCGVLGCAEIISAQAEAMPRGEIAALAREITNSGRRLHRLVNRFLSYARIEMLAKDAPSLPALLQGRTFDTRAVILGTATERAEAHGRKGNLILNLETTPAAISEENLKTIIGELTDNAFKYSKAGSPVNIGTVIEDHQIKITIWDRGRGMSPAQIAAVGAFRQFDRSAHEQQGSGLGLAMACRLAELQGGSLAIASSPQDGTTVQIRLPLPPP